MPWIACGPGCPPEITGDSVGSTANTLSFGQTGFKASATPVMWPPVPTPVISASIGISSKSSRISRAVVLTWIATFAGFSNCPGIQLFGVDSTIAYAFSIAPLTPSARGVSAKVAP
jgi:hypothetical protein